MPTRSHGVRGGIARPQCSHLTVPSSVTSVGTIGRGRAAGLRRSIGSRDPGRFVFVIDALPAKRVADFVWHFDESTANEESSLWGLHDAPAEMWMAKQAH